MRMRCTICASERLAAALRFDGYEIRRCAECTHLFVTDRVAANVLDKAYDQAFFVQQDAGAKPEGYGDYLATLERRIRGFRDWYAEITPVVGGPGRSLDFGCAVGAMVRAAQDCGWDAVGYERSDWAARYGNEHLGVRIVTGDGNQDPFEPSTFDLVTMWDVVEHLEQPREVIAMVTRWLRPGGWLALNTVDSGSVGAKLAGERWRHLGPPRHLQYFNRRSLWRLLESSGYDIRNARSNGVMFEAQSRDRPLGRLAALVEDGVTHWRTRRLAHWLNLKDEVEVLARRH
jgi:SAM-dependent methyltransferase